MGLWRISVLVLSLCLGVSRGAAKETWSKLENEDEVLLTDVPEKDAIEFAVAHAALRQAFREFVAPEGRRLPPTNLVLFKSSRELQRYCVKGKQRDSTIVTFSTEVDDRALIAHSLEMDRRKALETSFTFETHLTLRDAGYFLPLWMSQGVSEVFSTLEIRDGACVFGRRRSGLRELLASRSWLAWSRVNEITTGSPEYANHEKEEIYYAQVYALMHWVLLGDGDHARERLAAVAAKVAEGRSLASAISAALGVEAADLEGVVKRHLRNDHEIRRPFDAAGVRTRLRVAPAPVAELRVTFSHLLRACDRTTEADQELAQAVALAPNAIAVLEARGRRELFDGRPAQAAALYREAIKGGSTSTTAFMISAEHWLDQAGVAGTDFAGQGGELAESALADARRAVALDRGNAKAYRVLARALFVSDHLVAGNLAEIEPGMGDEREGAAIREYRGLLLKRLGRIEEARAEFQRLLDDPKTPVLTRRAVEDHLERAQAEAVQQSMERLTEAGKYAEAREQADRMLAGQIGREARQHLRSLRSWVDEQEAIAKLNELGQRDDPRAFIEAAQDFVNRFSDSPVAAELRLRLKKLAP